MAGLSGPIGSVRADRVRPGRSGPSGAIGSVRGDRRCAVEERRLPGSRRADGGPAGGRRVPRPDRDAEINRSRQKAASGQRGRPGAGGRSTRSVGAPARNAPERQRTFPAPTYLPNVNVPFSHPSGGRAQKDGRKVRSCDEGTFTSSTAVDIRRGPPGAAGNRAPRRPGPAPHRNQRTRMRPWSGGAPRPCTTSEPTTRVSGARNAVEPPWPP